MSLPDTIADALGASGALDRLTSTLGTTDAETRSLIEAGLPPTLGGLGAQSGDDGAAALAGLLGDDGGSFADHLDAFFARGDKTGLANKLVGTIFGSRRGAVEAQVAATSGAALPTVTRFLPLLAPAALSLLAKVGSDESLDAEALATQLAAIGADGELGDILAAATDADRAGFVTGIAELRDAGGLAALVPAGATEPPARAVAAAAPAAVTEPSAPRSGLAWVGVTLLPLLALIAGLVLWQCSSLGDDDGDEVPVATVADADEGEGDAEGEPAAEPEPEATATPEPEPTATPEPEPTATAEPVVTIADLAAGSSELSTLVALADQLGLADAIADPDAGPFTVFAPTNDAFDAAGDVLGRLDDDQTRTTVSFHVVPQIVSSDDLVPGATFETLAGETITVDDDGTLTGGIRVTTADLVADNGVVHIVENVLVPGSIRRFLTTEDVNQLFELEPIQFASGSAEILPESITTLDAAVETLGTVPPGSRFEVQGHTDTDGSDAVNQALSEQRAAAVVAYLVDNGVDPELLEAVGYGETQLKVDPELTPEDKAQNRRIEFVDISS